MKSTLLILLVSVAGLALIPSSFAQAPATGEAMPELSAPVERELAGGASHSYRITSEGEQFLHARVQQQGIDVVLFLRRSADGKEIARTDSPNGSQGNENLLALVATAGEFELVVASEYPSDDPGAYRLELIEHRPPVALDRPRVEAERLTFEAYSLWLGGDQGSRGEAIARFRETLPLWRQLDETRREAETQTNIGYVHRSLGEAAGELEPYREALILWRKIADREREAAVLNSLATAANQVGLGDEALRYATHAAELFGQLEDARGEGAALSTLGSIRLGLGELPVARNLFERSLVLRRQTGDRRGEGRTLNNLGRVLRQQGESLEAMRLLEEALTLARATGDRLGEAGALNNLVSLYTLRGETRRSLELYHQVLELARAMGNRRVEAFALNNMGTLHRSLGEPGEAIGLYHQATELAKKLEDPAFEAKALDNTGWAYLGMDQPEQALPFIERSLELASHLEAPRQRIITEVNLSIAHSALGHTVQALSLAQQARARAQKLGESYVEAVAELRLGEALRNAGRSSESLTHLTRAHTRAQELGFLRLEAGVLFQQGQTERALGRLDEARRHLAQSVGLVDTLRAEVTVHELRASFLAKNDEYYEAYIDLLMELHRREPAAGHHIAALEADERGRARTLLDALEEIRGQIRQGVDPDLLEREQSLRAQLNEREQERIESLANGASPDEVQRITRQIQDLRLENRALEERLRSGNPRYAALIQPVPLSVVELQKLLGADTVLLQYSLGQERSFLWAVTDDSVTSYALPPAAKLEADARLYYELLTAPNQTPPVGETRAERAQRLATAEERLAEVGQRLSNQLLAPAATNLEGRRLVIAADGALLYVPFAALPSPLQPKEPLVARHVTVNLPSASVLAGLRRESPRPHQPEGELAVVADPVFRGDDRRVRQARRAAEADVEAGAAPASDSSGLRSAGARQDFQRLHFSRQEAETIAALVPESQRLTALDFSARKQLATEGGLNGYRRLHLATHGILNTEVPALSGLVLSLFDEHGEPQEGLLRLHDIYNLELSAELVTLSACETALGKHLRGEGLIGLTRGFMYAGAPRVVASLWQVQDRATATLMETFYQSMLRDGQAPAEALRSAQASLWQSERWSAPYYWAPFVLHGEWR